MPIIHCPFCGSSKYRSLKKNNITRCCDREVYKVNGRIYADLADSPEWRLMQAFVKQKQKSDPYYEIPYHSKAYKENFRSVRTLLGYCKGDVEWAEEAINVCFEHEAHKWRNYPSFYAVLNSNFFMDVRAKARMRLERTRAVEKIMARRVADGGLPEHLRRHHGEEFL